MKLKSQSQCIRAAETCPGDPALPALDRRQQKVLSYLARALALQGADVTVLTSQISGNDSATCADAEFEEQKALATNPQPEPGRLSVVRLKTSRVRFLGTWLYMRNLRNWFDRNQVDLAYVSMLKHDAYVVVKAGKRLNFPVVLRPEGAGATGDVAWQSLGNFGRLIGRTCRQADAIVSISKAVQGELEHALRSGTMRPSRSEAKPSSESDDRESFRFPTACPCPCRPGRFVLNGQWPRANFRRPIGSREGPGYTDLGLASSESQVPSGPTGAPGRRPAAHRDRKPRAIAGLDTRSRCRD